MRKLTLFLACMLMTFFSIGQVWANPVTITASDFTPVESADYSTTKEGITVAVTASTVTADQIRVFKGKTITISAASNITSIEFTCTANGNAKYGPGCFAAQPGYTYEATGKKGTWTGSSTSVVFTASTNQVRISQMVVTLEETQKPTACAKPTFLPAAGTYVGAQEITLSCETDGATIHYTLNGDTPDENSPEYTEAILVSATTTIKAIAVKDQLDNSDVASATYKIIQHAGTLEDPYDIADARLAIDGNVGLSGVYMSGIISQITEAFNPGYGNISFDITADGSTTAESIRAYRCKGISGADLTSENDVKAGATVTVYGDLTKYGSTYEFAQGCYLAAYQAPAVQPEDISNTKATAYTVSKALELATATDPPSDLTKHVFIKGVVYLANSFNKNNGTYNIYIREAEKDVVDGNFEFFKCEGLFDETLNAVVPFEENGVLEGDTVIGYGTMTYYSNGGIWEFSAGNYLVELHRPFVAVENVEISQPTASIEVNQSVTLTAAVKPDNASNKEVVWSIESGADFIEFNNGVVTGIAAGEAVIRATAADDNTKYAECTVTINAAPEGDYVTFDATEDLSEGELSISKGGFKLTFTNGVMNNKQQYRLYKNQTMTLSSTDYMITRIDFTCTTDKPISGFADAEGLDKTNSRWTGSANPVELKASNDQVRIEKLKVYYKEDTRADAGMAWEPALSEITYDPSVTTPADLAVPEFVMANAGPAELALVEFVSDNTDLMTVNGGVISWNFPATGTAHVTATFPGNDAFKPATVSCTIIVNEPAPTTAKVKFYAPSWENVYAYTWYWDGSTNTEYNGGWYDCQLDPASDKEGDWWIREMPIGANIIFHNGNGTQTADINNVQEDACYAWFSSMENQALPLAVTDCAVNFYLTGENLSDKISWDPASILMTNNKVEFEKLPEGSYKFKVTNGTWDYNWGASSAEGNISVSGDNDNNVNFSLTAEMNVTISFDPATEKITVNGIVPPEEFDPNIKFGSATGSTKISDISIQGVDNNNNTWTITTVPGASGKSFTQNAEYSQVGASSKPAESITFSTTLANSEEMASISYIAIKLGGFNSTAGNVVIKVDGISYASGALDGTNDVIIATNSAMLGREIVIEITDIARGVKCYGIKYAYKKYEPVALKFFAPRDESNKFENVYAYAYDPNNNDEALAAWPGHQLLTKDAEWYVYNAPKGFNVIFHDNQGMQSNDIVDVQETACYAPTSIDYNANPKIVNVAVDDDCQMKYYIAGVKELIGGEEDWQINLPLDENNQIVFKDVAPGTYSFKLNINNWAWSLGGNDHLKGGDCASIAKTVGVGDVGFYIDTKQDITITYYPEDQEICLGAVTAKLPGEVYPQDLDLFIDEWKTPTYGTNIEGFTAEDITLTFVEGDDCVEISDGQIRGKALGTAILKLAIAETALYTAAEATFTVTVKEEEVPVDPWVSVRTGLTKDSYYTICLPKNIVSVEGASFWNLRHKNAEPATFVYLEEVKVIDLEAGKPYIFQAEAETLKVVLGDVEETQPVENFALRGTFEDLSIADFDAIPGNIYILKNNAIRPRLAGENWLNANRAYIDYDALVIGVPNAAPGKRVRAIPMHENNTTDFENVQSDKVQSTKILINGHLYIMHNGTMYNVQGIIVK